MKLENINHQELKNLINLMYMHGENQNDKAVSETADKIKEFLKNNEFIISTENNSELKIPYGKIENNQYTVPIYTDKREYEKGLEYYRLNEMDEGKNYKIEKLNNEKINEDPNFLGYLINMASVSYITLI